ncbi:MAG TPA: hypothetical protein VLM43_08690, partial [Desulfobacterales bacterium]|nr:hypothetical protein [Desulfobacterales bacterium]
SKGFYDPITQLAADRSAIRFEAFKEKSMIPGLGDIVKISVYSFFPAVSTIISSAVLPSKPPFLRNWFALSTYPV